MNILYTHRISFSCSIYISFSCSGKLLLVEISNCSCHDHESILHKYYFTFAVMCIIQVSSCVHYFKSGKMSYILYRNLNHDLI